MKNKGKILLSFLAVLMAAVMLTTAGFAWFTLSTNPEIRGMQFSVAAEESMLISTDKGVTFHRSVDLSERMAKDMNVLRPVSTIDGMNWYVCDYHITNGNIKETEFFLLDWCEDPAHDPEHPDHGKHTHCTNARGYELVTDEETGEETVEYIDEGFYAYTDIWVKSEAGSCNVRLSIPGLDQHYQDEESSGSYVLSYDIVEQGEGSNKKQAVKILSRGPETCARVGMLVFKPTDPEETNDHVVLAETADTKTADPNKIEGFYIYEPNADVRSELDKQSDQYLSDIYVSMLKIKGYTGLDYDQTTSYVDNDGKRVMGKYIPTYPIRATGALKANNNWMQTTAALPHVFDSTRLLVQTGAYWDSSAINAAANSAENTLLNFLPGFTDLFEVKNGPLDIIETMMKNDYVKRGRFIANTSALYKKAAGTAINTVNTDYAPVELGTESTQTGATSQVMFTLEKGEIRQIRLFFWIEGQDIDCWNDVAGMNFLTRVEFATEVK